MHSESPRPFGSGLRRLLRRRARAKRLSRSYQGKEYQSWGEYAPKTLQTTGDHSHRSRWAYMAICCGAILIVPLIIGLLNLNSPLMEGQPIEWRVIWLFQFLLPFLLIAAIVPAAAFVYVRWQAWKQGRTR